MRKEDYYMFGYECGKHDDGESLWDMIENLLENLFKDRKKEKEQRKKRTIDRLCWEYKKDGYTEEEAMKKAIELTKYD